jgi:hypothetical protein
MQIAKVLDLNGSVLNLPGYNALRKGVKGDVEGYIECNGSWLTSKDFVMKVVMAVETAANAVIPFHPMGATRLDDGIDGIVFEYSQMFAYLLKLFSLDDIARNPNHPPVEFLLHWTAQICRVMFHTSQLASKSTTHGLLTQLVVFQLGWKIPRKCKVENYALH